MDYRGTDIVSVRRFADLLKASKVSGTKDLKLATRILDKTVKETYNKGQDPKRVCATLGGFPIAVTDDSIRCLSDKEAHAFNISAEQRQFITLNILKSAGGLFLSEKEKGEVNKATTEFSKHPSSAFRKICRVFWEAATRKNVAISLSLVISFALAFIALTSAKGHVADSLKAAGSLFSRLDSARIQAGEGLSSFVERLSNWVKPDVQKMLTNLQEARATAEQEINSTNDILRSVQYAHDRSKDLMESHNIEANSMLREARSLEDQTYKDLWRVPVASLIGGLAGGAISHGGAISRAIRGAKANRETRRYASSQKDQESEAVAQIVSVLNGAKGVSIDKTQVVNLVKKTFEADYTAGTLPSKVCGTRAVPLALVGAPENPKIVCIDHETERRLGSILNPTMTTMLSLAVAEKASHVLADTSAEQSKLRRLAKEAFEKPAEKFKALVMAIYDIGKRNKIQLTVGFVGLLAVALIAKSNRFQNIQYLQTPLQMARQAWDMAVDGASDLRSKMSKVFATPQNWILSLTHGKEEVEKVRQLQEDLQKNQSLYDTMNSTLSDNFKALKDQDRFTELALGKKKDAEAVLSRARSMKEKGDTIALAAGVASGAMGLISGVSMGRARTADARALEAQRAADTARGTARASRLARALHKQESDKARTQLQQGFARTLQRVSKEADGRAKAADERAKAADERAKAADERARDAQRAAVASKLVGVLQKQRILTDARVLEIQRAKMRSQLVERASQKEADAEEPDWLSRAYQNVKSLPNATISSRPLQGISTLGIQHSPSSTSSTGPSTKEGLDKERRPSRWNVTQHAVVKTSR